MSQNHKARFHDIDVSRKSEFVQLGYKGRHFFPHRFYHLPKCGPDGFKLAQRMCGEHDPNRLSELVLYAGADMVREFPNDLFFDEDVVWHQQQFGRPGQLATANLRAHDNELYSMVHISDLVQRISRRPEYKSRIENRFKGWPRMLINAILAHATENDFKRVFLPTSALAIANTDPKRSVQRPLFERVYDHPLACFDTARIDGWWVLEVARNRARVVLPTRGCEPIPDADKVICICHDIERGLGHRDCDPEFARAADRTCMDHLLKMAEIEHSLGIRATYNIVGCIMNEVRQQIEALGHEVAFHSYNHVLTDPQLGACRSVDYRIKGYRTPQSRLTEELTDAALCYHNFEWLASSAHSLGVVAPILENGIVKIPVHFDDFELYAESTPYEKWERKALDRIQKQQFVALGLHDCYAGFWLPHYRGFLRKISSLGVFLTLNEVASNSYFHQS